jgi:hypothetical protein
VYSTGGVFDSTFENVANYAIALGWASYAHLEGNHVVGGGTNLATTNGSRVTGTGNVLCGGTYATIFGIWADEDFPFRGNHILNAGGYSVMLGGGRDGSVDLPRNDWSTDLSRNYWGTADAEQIAAWIWDGHDDPSIHGVVVFEPFAGGPMPSESRSWGAVKDIYRGAGR